MANYSLVVDSNFQPFSFERYIQPYQIYGQEYKAQEDALSELAIKSSIWKNLVNEQAERDTYEMYKKYSDDLAMQAEQLAREGLSPLSRQNMLNMKRRYSNEIVPIENAYNRRQALIDEQRKLNAADGTMMYDIDASTLSLDDLIRNPQLTYKSLSGDLLKKRVGDAAKNLAQSMRKNERYWRSVLNNQYYETIMQSGFKPSEILNTLKALADKNPAVNNELTKIVEDVVNSSGVKSWGSQDIIKKAYQYAGEGLWEAVGKTDYQMQANRAFGMDIPSPNGRGNENDYSFQLERHKLGTSGIHDKSLDQFEGLRMLSNGDYTTAELDKIEGKITSLEKTLFGKDIDEQFYTDLQNLKDIKDPEEYEAAVNMLGEKYHINPNVDFSKINKLLLDKSKIKDKQLEELKKYSHLGKTPYEQLFIGTALAKNQQTEASYDYTLPAKESYLNNIKNSLRESLNIYNTKENLDNKNIGLFEINRKSNKPDVLNKADSETIEDIINNVDRTTIKVHKGKNGISLGFNYGGKEYIIKGNDRIGTFNTDVNIVNNYLKDYSNSEHGVANAVNIDNKTLQKVLSGNYINLPNLTSVNLENGFKGVTFKTENGDYMKIIIKDGKTVAINTLFNEINPNEDIRAGAIEKMIANGLASFGVLYN